MEDLVLCYDNRDPLACEFAAKMCKSMKLILDFGVRDPRPTDKTSFVPSAANLGLIITPDCCSNPVVLECLEKAANTKKNVIYIEDLMRGGKAEKEVVGLDDTVMKKLKDAVTTTYVLECFQECNDYLLTLMKFGEPGPLLEAKRRREQQKLDDILRFSAKVSKMRIKAQMKRRYDFCVTAAGPTTGPDAEKTVLAIKEVFDRYAPALTVVANRGDKSTAASSVRIGNVGDSFNLVVCVTKKALADPDLLDEIRAALEMEVAITLVVNLTEVKDVAAVIEEVEDPILRSFLGCIIPFPYLAGNGPSVVRALLVPHTVKVDDQKTPRTRGAGIQTFKLGYKNAQCMDMPTDGRMQIYRLAKEEADKPVPQEIADSIKDLWAIYDKEGAKKITWEEFVEVDRLVVETVGADYSEMVSRRIYSMMLYPGLTLDEKVTFQTFKNYYEYTAKKMGGMSSESAGDVRTHFKYVVDKVKFMQKGKRYQKKWDLYVTHDRSKQIQKFALEVVNAVRAYTPNVRICMCTDKKHTPEFMAANTLNLVVLASSKAFHNDAVKLDVEKGVEAGAKMIVLCDVTNCPEILREITTADPIVANAFSRPTVCEFYHECPAASAMTLLDNLFFPGQRPSAVKASVFRRRDNPVVLYMYQECQDENELANALQALSNMTSPSTLNGAEMRENFARDGGAEILNEKFGDLSSVAVVAENGLRACANVSQTPSIAKRLAELGMVDKVLACIANHSDNPMVQGEGCRTISNMAADETAKWKINQQQGFQKVLQTQKKNEHEPPFWDARFAFKKLNANDLVMVNYRGRDLWCSGEVVTRNSNGTYDIKYAHGGLDAKVPSQWVRPKGPADNVAEFCAVWGWKPTGKLTEDELHLKSDGMCTLRSGAVGTWNPKDTKGKKDARTAIKLQVGSLMIEMERISLTMLRSTTTSHRAVLKGEYLDCLYTEYFNFPEGYIENRIPNLLGRRPDITRLEQIVCWEPQKGEQKPWVGLPEAMNENFCASWNGYIEIVRGGQYMFALEANSHAKLLIDDNQVLSVKQEDEGALASGDSTVVLTAGQRAIRLEYAYKCGGSKSIIMHWKGPDTDDEKRVVPAAVFQHDLVKSELAKKPGVIAKYWQGEARTGQADIIRVEKQLDFADAAGEPWERLPLRYNGDTSFCALFTCYLKLLCGGKPKAEYTFRVESGGNAKVYKGGEVLTDKDEPITVVCTPGEHLFEIEYSCKAKNPHGIRFFFCGPETSPGEDEETKDPLPGVEKMVQSQFTRHFIKPQVVLAKGDPIQVSPHGSVSRQSKGGGGQASVVSVKWANDDSCIVSCDKDGLIKTWNVVDGTQLGLDADGNEASPMDCQQNPNCTAIGNVSSLYATGLLDGNLQIWDLAKRTQIEAKWQNEETGEPGKMNAHEGDVFGVAFNHDDTLLASVGADGTIRIWDVATQQEKTDMDDPLVCYYWTERKPGAPPGPCGHKSAIPPNESLAPLTLNSCSFSIDGKYLAVASDDKRIRLVQTNQEEPDFVRGPDISVEVEPPPPEEGEEPVEPEEDAEPPPKEYRTSPGEVFLLLGHDGGVTCVSFSPQKCENEGQYLLASASLDATIRIWLVNLEPKTDNNSNKEHINAIQCLSTFCAWSPDGATLISSSESIFFQLWSAVSGRSRGDGLAGHASALTAGAFAPYGQSIASSSEDGTLRLWHFLVNRNIVEIAKLEKEQMQLNTEMTAWEKKLAHIQKNFTDYTKALAYKEEVYWLNENLTNGKERTESFNQREQLLGLDVTDYYELDGMIDDYSLYFKLWDTVIRFVEGCERWETVPLNQVDAIEAEASLDQWFRGTIAMIKVFDSQYTRDPQKIAKQHRDGIEEFRKTFPFVRAFSAPSILHTHWDELFSRMKKDRPCDYKEITARQMLNLGVLDFTEDFEELSAAAYKEDSLKKQLATMKHDWIPIAFETKEFKETKCKMLQGIDDVQTVLDDHIVKTQGIRSSPFCKPFEAEVHEWEARLLYIQDFVDQTLQVQRTWMSLEPIFVSDDIKRQLPTESSAFADIDKMFREYMDKVSEDTHGLAIAAIPQIVENMTEANNTLEKIQKGLKDYLETKRLYFPRFFFLNDADLLSILAETKDPTLVQPHIGKAFEGIATVQFSDDSTLIQGMNSPEGEKIQFYQDCNVDSPVNRGNVEKWLLEVEEIHFDTLRLRGHESNAAYASQPRSQWCTEWPGQIIILTNSIVWTTETYEALKRQKVAEHSKHLHAQISDIVVLVRGELTRNARTAVGAMVTLDVHSRDVVDEFVDNKVDSPDAFDYLSQLRYYWQLEGGFLMISTGEPNAKKECQVSIVNATLLYGFEYLGNSARLVVTPLTDRCYRTLVGAFALYYGGAPEGPAGTGKTESTKDLAKALAICCVVFNCSDSMDYLQLAKFFKGLASSGAWCCFDEFNRISLEVLSVVAQQIQQISLAIQMHKRKFVFEGTEIALIPTCAVNITMNPGYAGRSELPDNLKALFRPVAMMVPNYALIAEIRLYSFGYVDARRIGVKATQALKLSSEQLSPQRHYDFGMRGLNALLVAGGNGKRKYGDSHPEEVVALRSFMDVNMPKFTSADIPLFKGIIGDLFPGVKLLESDYGPLMVKVESITKDNGLQATEQFMGKVVQLWETVMVRHGLMTVGIPPCGKTNIKDVLAATLAAVSDGGDMFMPVTQYCMNPKSITQGQLYGEADLYTQEWTDGVLAIAVRNAAKAYGDGKRQWVVLDGPVDAIWIENMNTVLDDNKKLCLNSGEIIKLSICTTMLFEVRDLDYASPATVSRVGIVFLEPDADLGWMPIIESWLLTLPDFLSEHIDFIRSLFVGSFGAFLEVGERSHTPVLVSNNWLAMMATRLFSSLVTDTTEKLTRPNKKNDDDEEGQDFDDREVNLVQIYYFSSLWTCGACSNQDGRDFFNLIMRSVAENKKDGFQKMNMVADFEHVPLTGGGAVPPMHRGVSMHDFYIDSEDGGKWKPWTERIGSADIGKDVQFHQIIVQTTDTVRNQFLLRTLVENNRNVMISGPTGTAKTASINGMLLGGFSPDLYSTISFAFSAQTTCNQTQDIIDGKLDKRKKGVFGPPINKKMLVFIDDLNMPTKEEYGAQPPIEILRQQFIKTPFGMGWYDRKGWEFRNLIDMIYLCAMGPPGAGKNDITDRYSAQFNLVFVTPFDDESLIRIFSTSVGKFFGAMSRDVAGQVPALVQAVLDVYNTVSKDLLPTPAKSHYTFNMRDVSKVFQGVCVCSRESLPKIDDLVRCWMHECERVFKDRLTNKPDQNWFNSLLKKLMDRHFKRAFDQVMRNDILVFADFCDPKTTIYQEVQEIPRLQAKMSEAMDEFNQTSKVRLELVLFATFIQHICRVIRVLRLPLGNALLVGVGGSGRKSTTILATYVADNLLFQIEIAKGYGMNEWHEDIKRLLMGSGALNKVSVFLFPDTQIANETFLEEVSSILNTGEVPNLYQNEDKMEIAEKCSKAANAAGKFSGNEVFAFYVDMCRKNTHIVLAMSPIGATFRNRLRAFPSLVNCCTIDWFMNWPPDALQAVAHHFLKSLPDMEEKVMDSVVKIMVDCQMVVTDLTERFLTDQKRYFYVTPSSYLELINSFTGTLLQERARVKQAKWRYDVGLEKIADAAGQVAALQKDLEDLQPILEKSAKETSEMMVRVETQQNEAEEKQVIVDEEARKADIEAKEATAIKADCEKDLAAAMPALEAAVDALSKLSKGDIGEVKAMKTPPAGVLLVAQAMCYMFQVKPVKVAAPDGKGKVDDFWEPCKKELLGDSRLLNHMIDYDKDNMAESTIAKVTPLYNDPSFEPDVIKKASIAAMGICKWVRAMVVYDKVAKEVGPKKAKLAAAEKSYADASALVAEKKEELAVVIATVEELVAELQKAKATMNELQKNRDDCANKLVRAEKLITGLGGEKVSWTNKAKKLGVDYTNLTGDILIAAGILAYLGVFTAQYRAEAANTWLNKLVALQVPARKNFSLSDVIGDQVKIRQWVIDNLPNDQLSIDNAIILSKSRRWPLMIDPQMQANKWVRSTHKDKLKIFRLTQNYSQKLEMWITMGDAVLLENVNEQLDAMLDPVLKKETYKQGTMEMLRFGDATIEWSKDFTMYITTKLPNPHYAPEVCVTVGLLNFMATLDGLQDQQLGILVAVEEPEVETKRQNLVIESAQAKAQLKEIEDKILALLSASTGNILDDEELIETLANSKVMSVKIEEQVQQQDRTAAQIADTRAIYRPLATRCACLYFIVGELCIIDPMYQFSLDWFIFQFGEGLRRAEKKDNREDRFAELFRSFLTLLYNLVCRSLFEEHKLLYSMLLTFKIQEIDKELNMPNMLALLTGLPGSTEGDKPEGQEWLTAISWAKIKNLQKLGGVFDGFQEEFKAQIEGWKAVFDSDEAINHEWPNRFKDKCKPLDAACMMYALRPDQTVPAIQGIVEDKLGRTFLEVPPYDLPATFKDAGPFTPIIFILSTGSDPMADIANLSNTIVHPDGNTMMSKIMPISLGQGQGPKAIQGIKEGSQLGKWTLLQNCHLATSFMTTLETLVEGLSHDLSDEPKDSSQTHTFFRLWLTACPSPAFPISVLQNGVKLTIEPPKGLRNSLMRAYLSFEEDWFETCSKPREFKKMLFGLCFFHALILERRKFGAIGWNIPYGFSEPDRDISRKQLKGFLDEFEGIPWAALQYMVSEANYGGRVTDSQDRRSIVQILEDFYNPEILKEGYKFSISGIYYAPDNGPLSSYLDYIKTLPLNQTPEIFWMHGNANLTAAINEAQSNLANAMRMINAFGGGGGDEDEEEGASKVKQLTPEQKYSELAAEIAGRMPKVFDLGAVGRAYPVDYNQCLNTVLNMELGKFNRLMKKVIGTMVDLQKAVKGLVVFSPELEECSNALLANKTPGPWMGVSYPCLKPLGSYVQHLLDRIAFYQSWVDLGAPVVFWFSAYFFQQAFLTGVVQNFARKDTIAIDRCIWNMYVMKEADANPEEGPKAGAYTRGVFMDGARWDDDDMVIRDSHPKVLWCEMPNIHLCPVELSNDMQTAKAHLTNPSIADGTVKKHWTYPAPVYKESLRRGVLSTSGHSSNFIDWFFLPISDDTKEQLWTKRGVALITMTND